MGTKNNRSPDENPEEAAGPSSADGFEQPLSEPEILEAGGEPEDPEASVEGTAMLGVKMMSIGCAMRFNAPLSDKEGAELQRDLTAVLVKYDAPNLPFVEELTLVANVGTIVFKRMANEHAQAAAYAAQNAATNPPPPPAPEGVPGNDLFSSGEEGQRQERSDTQARSRRAGGEAGDLLS